MMEHANLLRRITHFEYEKNFKIERAFFFTIITKLSLTHLLKNKFKASLFFLKRDVFEMQNVTIISLHQVLLSAPKVSALECFF